VVVTAVAEEEVEAATEVDEVTLYGPLRVRPVSEPTAVELVHRTRDVGRAWALEDPSINIPEDRATWRRIRSALTSLEDVRTGVNRGGAGAGLPRMR
jgi:hypothetical protein